MKCARAGEYQAEGELEFRLDGNIWKVFQTPIECVKIPSSAECFVQELMTELLGAVDDFYVGIFQFEGKVVLLRDLRYIFECEYGSVEIYILKGVADYCVLVYMVVK